MAKRVAPSKGGSRINRRNERHVGMETKTKKSPSFAKTKFNQAAVIEEA